LKTTSQVDLGHFGTVASIWKSHLRRICRGLLNPARRCWAIQCSPRRRRPHCQLTWRDRIPLPQLLQAV